MDKPENTKLEAEIAYTIGEFSIILNEENNELKIRAIGRYCSNMDIHPVSDNTIICKPIFTKRNKK